jgi:hypothetical protein
MNNRNSDKLPKLNPESENVLNNVPVYNPEMGNENGINYSSGEIKSHSFSVRHPHFLAGENIIFEPGDSNPDHK